MPDISGRSWPVASLRSGTATGPMFHRAGYNRTYVPSSRLNPSSGRLSLRLLERPASLNQPPKWDAPLQQAALAARNRRIGQKRRDELLGGQARSEGAGPDL